MYQAYATIALSLRLFSNFWLGGREPISEYTIENLPILMVHSPSSHRVLTLVRWNSRERVLVSIWEPYVSYSLSIHAMVIELK